LKGLAVLGPDTEEARAPSTIAGLFKRR